MRVSKRLTTTILCAGISSVALFSSQAQAQVQLVATSAEAPAASGTDGRATDKIDDIIVTGEKRETNIQSAPIAITAISGDVLQQRNINQVNDMNGYVPGLNIAKSEGAERIITIRGIGYETAQNPNSQPGVAFHIDGVYIAHVMALNQDLLDVDRIEVLRGPQGTVFGETSTGGAINVITKKPVIGKASGSLSVSGGNYNYIKGNGSANIPISDTMAARVSYQYLSHDGYGTSTAVPGTSEYQLDNASNIGVRGSLIWKPTDTFTALLEGQLFDTDRNASLQKNINDPNPDPRKVTQDYGGKFKLTTKMIYLTLSQEIGDFATAKSVTAYQYMNKNQTSDNDRLASPFYFDNITLWQDKSKTFTQEVSLASLGDSAFEWTVGGFYLRQHALQNILENYTFGLKFQTDSPYQHTSLAGYGNATLHVGDKLSLIAGARYNYDKITAQPVQYYAVVPPRASSSREVTGKVGAEYKLTPRNMVYITASHGYKPTGLSFNSGSLVVPTSFKKETVNALEIGTKNDFFDHKVRLNISGYYYWYNNFQFTAEDPIPFAGGTDNIPKAEIYGLEAEGSVLPFDGFRLDGNISLGKGTFKSHFNTIDAQSAAAIRAAGAVAIGCASTDVGCYFAPSVISTVSAGSQDVYGKRVPKQPGVQGQISATYAWKMFGGKMSLRGDATYRGAFNYRLFAVAALDRVDAYTAYNAFISFEPDDRPWSVSVSAINLTDKTGVNSKFSDPYGSGTTSVEYIDPRQVYGTVYFKF